MSIENTPRISIGLPVYNGEDYLALAIDSILAQTFTDFELIISDNASTDRTEAICHEYAARDSRIRYHRMPQNMGGAANYNNTIDMARGEYFKWAAHDDLIAPTFLEVCSKVLDERPDVVLVYAQVVNINEDGEIIEHYESGFNLTSDDPIERFRKFFKAPVKCNPVFGIMRTAQLRKTLRHGTFIAADRILLGELSLLGKIYEVPEHLFLRRIHPNMSTEANKSTRDLAGWFDPRNRHKIQLPKWQWLVEYMRAIDRVPLTAAQHREARKVVLQVMLPPRKWPAMIKEVAKAAVELPIVSYNRLRTNTGQ